MTYVEGYLWDAPEAKKAVLKAFDAAHAAGRQVSITLSDSFCVDRYRDEFRDLIRNKVDILFGNEAEIKSLYEVETFEEAMEATRKEAKIAALTRSEKGSVVIKGGETYAVPAAPVAKVVDTTGAGDLYAAGFLFGFTHGKPLAECARLGGIAAAEIISHVGARPETALHGPDVSAPAKRTGARDAGDLRAPARRHVPVPGLLRRPAVPAGLLDPVGVAARVWRQPHGDRLHQLDRHHLLHQVRVVAGGRPRAAAVADAPAGPPALVDASGPDRHRARPARHVVLRPAHRPVVAGGVFAVVVAFSSATQDIALDAFRIEATDESLQGATAATYQLGYRIAVLAAGAGALYIAEFGSWPLAYRVMASLRAGRLPHDPDHLRARARIAAARPSARARSPTSPPAPRRCRPWRCARR